MGKKRILIVEDDIDLVSLLDINLTRKGFLTEGALDGIEGLRKAASFAPDLVILDLMLPGMNGWDLCRELKKMNNGLPVLMFSAKYTPGDIDSGLEAGADGYVSKLGLNELFQKVQSLLDGANAA
ncbi:MAG: response regulator [Deltaproteobacteria bacterium]|nr:response regulator [Deltaproteobacteria bacterium]